MAEKRKYTPHTPEVLNSIRQDEVLRKQAREIKEIYQQKNLPPFKVAFTVLDYYEEWKKHSDQWSFNLYLEALIAEGKFKKKGISTLKLSLKVAKCFPDLIKPENIKLKFDGYREIVNTKLSPEQMKNLREEAEEHKYSGMRIREIAARTLGQNVENKEKPFEKTFTYREEDEFLQDIRMSLQDSNRPIQGTKFRLIRVGR